MSKKLLIMMIVSLCMFSTGCKTNDTLHRSEADASISIGDDCGTYEWVEFCKWIETLQYSELITGKEAKR